jgi:hypothetical protein
LFERLRSIHHQARRAPKPVGCLSPRRLERVGAGRYAERATGVPQLSAFDAR